jgi:hypothetical protein
MFKKISDYIKAKALLGDKTDSRKWKLILLIVWISTIGCYLPPIISVWLFDSIRPLIIISGTEYISLLTLAVASYFGANIWQKKIEGNVVTANAATSTEATPAAENTDEKEA